MANTKREKLFTEFPPVPTEQWEEVITADLKGADYERKLVWRTGEGFNVRPYYRAENLEGIRFLGSQAGEFPYVRGTRAHNRWRVHQTIEVKCPKEANAEALKLLNSGVDSLGFSIANEGFSAADLDQLLAEIHIPAIEMTFCGAHTGRIAGLVLDKLEKEGLAAEAHVAFCIDPLVKGLSQKGDFCSPDGEKCFAKIASLIERTREYKHIRIVTVSAGIFANAGSTIVEELAFTLSAAHDYLVKLTEAGLTVDEAARKIRFTFAVTSSPFTPSPLVEATASRPSSYRRLIDVPSYFNSHTYSTSSPPNPRLTLSSNAATSSTLYVFASDIIPYLCSTCGNSFVTSLPTRRVGEFGSAISGCLPSSSSSSRISRSNSSSEITGSFLT